MQLSSPSVITLAILQYLLLRRARPVPAEELAEVFWPEAPSVERTTLYATLTRLRHGLKAAGLGATTLRRERGGYRLSLPAETRVDLDAFDAEIRAGRKGTTGEAFVAHREQALSRSAGDLLEDAPYADWCSLDRDAVRARWVEAALALARAHEEEGRPERAIEWYQRALAREAILEDAHRGLMRCYARTGRRDQALRQYQRCAATVRQELDTLPDAETVAVHDAIVRGDAPELLSEAKR